MNHFSPASERNHRMANAGHDVEDYCSNCGLSFMAHTNGVCPDGPYSSSEEDTLP